MSTGLSISWSQLRRGLERLRRPKEVLAALKTPASPQVLLATTEMFVTSNDGGRKIDIDVENLGEREAKLETRLVDRRGHAVKGPQVKPTPTHVLQKSNARCTLKLTKAQMNKLLDGGALIFGPGDLPESHRSLRIRTHPLLPVRRSSWTYPLPPTYLFSISNADVESGGLLGIELEMEVDSPEGGVEKRLLGALEVDGGAAHLHLVVPAVPFRYRFRANGRTFRDPGSPHSCAPPLHDWSYHEPSYLVREVVLDNPTGTMLAGTVEVQPDDLVEVSPSSLEIAAGESETLTFKLLAGKGRRGGKDGGPVVRVVFRPSEPFLGSSEPVQFVEWTLEPSRQQEAVLQPSAPLSEELVAMLENGCWRVRMPIENVGGAAARVVLKCGSGASEPVEIPAHAAGPAGEPLVSFDLPKEAVSGEPPERAVPVRLESDQVVWWSPELRMKELRLRRLLGDGLSLAWRLDRRRSGRKALVWPVLRNEGGTGVVVERVALWVRAQRLPDEYVWQTVEAQSNTSLMSPISVGLMLRREADIRAVAHLSGGGTAIARAKLIRRGKQVELVNVSKERGRNGTIV